MDAAGLNAAGPDMEHQHRLAAAHAAFAAAATVHPLRRTSSNPVARAESRAPPVLVRSGTEKRCLPPPVAPPRPMESVGRMPSFERTPSGGSASTVSSRGSTASGRITLIFPSSSSSTSSALAMLRNKQKEDKKGKMLSARAVMKERLHEYHSSHGGHASTDTTHSEGATAARRRSTEHGQNTGSGGQQDPGGNNQQDVFRGSQQDVGRTSSGGKSRQDARRASQDAGFGSHEAAGSYPRLAAPGSLKPTTEFERRLAVVKAAMAGAAGNEEPFRRTSSNPGASAGSRAPHALVRAGTDLATAMHARAPSLPSSKPDAGSPKGGRALWSQDAAPAVEI
ncbi:hypothetical protein T484DRAFT_1965277 [Baffinella frigidus]|nr:hypothetical protein T484DRAFT_1965277 [Cryptophyta sp. CCMP2293]|mmetsp:Transcript_63027/g.150345  ORF Transcript_63027/g.150345 Transcript_63027/m.150345 type:complete len:338 (+) Transcript_63027:98-1111(+)|eukprot:CAMPEP_0180141470 /NCGR_PEP_ID=MMETSP0986-20121125/14920_1 /TAXON_ID=697907 /ORGANISM="non described non described, Strain CCMP2293" /LENGTH=337 /DNA_ID=CAMNT_0022084315 /DNA_START=43 /DNA_END=1056 /DNA_ORIENTATION=+